MANTSWKPSTKTQATMKTEFRGLSPDRRMKMAVQSVIDGKYNQSEAARMHGVDRSRLNRNLKVAQAAIDDQHQRSVAAAAERRAASPAPSPEPVGQAPALAPALGLNETRRIQPFEEFDRVYFGGLECFDCGVHHPVPAFHTEMMETITGPNRRQLINMPPGHSKSTIGTVKSTVYELCRDPNSMTAIVSKSQTLAKKFLYLIAKYLSDPAMYDDCERNLIDDWGPFHNPDNWSAGQLYVAGRNSADKDPSVAAFGVGGHVYGIRAHRMIMDDIADLENQANAERVQEMLLWCLQEAGSRVGRHGKLIFIGTRVRAGDIYSLLQDLPGFSVLRYPCIIDEGQGLTLWPDHYPIEAAVAQRDSMTPEQWQLVYQNVDTPGFGADFPPEVIVACHDADRVLGQYDPKWALLAGLDLAGAGAQSGFTAFILLGVDLETGKRYLVDMVNAKQMKAPQLRDQIFEWADRYPLRELRVEVNGLQAQLVQYNEEILSRLTNRGVRVVPHWTGRNKADPQFGVQSMSPMFYNRQINLPWGDIATRTRVRALEEQLQGFPMARVSDLVMALWFTELAARETFQRSVVPLFDPRARIPSRLASRRRVIDFSERTVKAPSEESFELPSAGRQMFPGKGEHRRVQLVNTNGAITLP